MEAITRSRDCSHPGACRCWIRTAGVAFGHCSSAVAMASRAPFASLDLANGWKGATGWSTHNPKISFGYIWIIPAYHQHIRIKMIQNVLKLHISKDCFSPATQKKTLNSNIMYHPTSSHIIPPGDGLRRATAAVAAADPPRPRPTPPRPLCRPRSAASETRRRNTQRCRGRRPRRPRQRRSWKSTRESVECSVRCDPWVNFVEHISTILICICICICVCVYIYALVSFLIQLMNLKTKVLKLMRTESCGSWSPWGRAVGFDMPGITQPDPTVVLGAHLPAGTTKRRSAHRGTPPLEPEGRTSWKSLAQWLVSLSTIEKKHRNSEKLLPILLCLILFLSRPFRPFRPRHSCWVCWPWRDPWDPWWEPMAI